MTEKRLLINNGFNNVNAVLKSPPFLLLALLIYEAGYLRRVVKGGLGGFFYAVSSGLV